MTGPTSQQLWELFLEEGTQRTGQARELLDRLAATSAEPGSADWRLLSSLLETVEAECALMGVPEASNLARKAKLAVLGVGADPGGLLQRLGPAVQALERAFDQLRTPDASGAHLDSGALSHAMAGLDAPSPAPTPAPPPAVEPADDVWVPQVDQDMVEPFLEECTERIDALGTHLLELESTRDPELVRTIFRDLHTLKGSSGFVGLHSMNRLAHAAEDLVGEIRDGRRVADREVTDALLASLDGLRAILQRAASGARIDVPIQPLLARLRGEPAGEPPPAAAPEPPVHAPPARSSSPTLRVDFDKLDHLLNLVGELVLGKAEVHGVLGQLNTVVDEMERRRRLGATEGRQGLLPRVEVLCHDLEDATGQLDMVSAELRDQVMKLRMVPIAGLFNKYRRVVRDLAHSQGKEVELEINGAETELDKLLVEQLDDPLLHLVRNAVDHGIESPPRREAAGKPTRGRLLLGASHRGNQIVIEVSDDGAGIDADRVAAKALDRGLVDADELARMDAHQKLELIFMPGLSTAAQITGISGRGVGMDVVREAIVGLKGSIEIESAPGDGARFELRLPLTLAISNVLLCRAGGQVLAVPIHAVKHTLIADPRQTRKVAAFPTLRLDQEIPLIDVAEVLGLPPTRRPPPFPVALVESLGGTYGLIFDELLGRQEIVIKSLGTLLERVPCCAGATLLGEHCALILDVPGLVRRALDSPTPATPEAGPVPGDAAPTILVAEDSDTVREDLRRLLTGAGYAVDDARDGEQALGLARTRRYDLVSTDVNMPGMDGYELCRRLRQLPAYRDVPILMLTGRDQEIDRQRGFDAGVDDYLIKPVARDKLTELVRRLLETAPATHEEDPA